MTEREPVLREKLESGWDWIKANPTHPDIQSFFERWESLNQEYMTAYVPDRPLPITLPAPSPWIEELREQLTLGGVADVEPRREVARHM